MPLRLASLVLLFLGCAPAQEAHLRVVNASSGAAFDVEVAGVPLAWALRFGEVSDFLPVSAGLVSATVQAASAPPVSSTLTLVAGATQTVLLTPGPSLLTHAFLAPEPASIRVRLFNGLNEPLQLELAGTALGLSPGTDSGPEGVALPAGLRNPLALSLGSARWRFTVPALPAQSEVLLVATLAGDPVLLAVAPSAALGVLQGVRE